MADEQQYAQGGYIEGPAPFQSAGCVIYIHPDECLISAENVRAGRIVCSRHGHPTPTSDCHRG